MGIRPPDRKPPTPNDTLTGLNLGYNGYTDPTQTKPQMWAAATNVFSGAFGFLQRARFANLNAPGFTSPFTSLKFFGLPGLSSYILADAGGKLWSYDTATNPYNQTQRLNPYVDPAGAGSSVLNGPWSREVLQNIVYEMNGQVKQAGRLANAATIEGWGLDAPDTSPQVNVFSSTSQTITAIVRSNGTVTVTVANSAVLGVGTVILNVAGVTDTSFNGTFTCTIVNTTTITYLQQGLNSSSSGGNINNAITKAVGRSYAFAWENANKVHVGPPSPATQYIPYNVQNGVVFAIEGTAAITLTLNSAVVQGTGTFFTAAWIGRHIWVQNYGDAGRIVSVQSTTQLTVAAPVTAGVSLQNYTIFDPQATHIRFYATADGGATYFRVSRNIWNPAGQNTGTAGLQFNDNAASEPPAFPFTTETAQINNVPPPVGAFVKEYQGRLVVFGVPGAPSSFFYSNQEATSIGQPQESFAPLNQVTVPIQNSKLNGWVEFPGAAIFWSDKQDMFRLTGLLTDNTVPNVVNSATAAAQGATIAQLPFGLGCASPFAVDLTPLGAIWLTSNAEVWLYTDTYAPRNIGRPVQDILSSISPANLSLARARYYHAGTRNWFVLLVPANGSSFNNTALILDLDLLASNGSPSYFTFDMATNSPSWFVFQPGTTIGGNWVARADSLDVVYEQSGGVRLIVGQLGLLQDIDFDASPNGGFGIEIAIPNGTVTLHAWGNDSAISIKKPGWFRFLTNRDPSMLVTDGWSFAALGIDDDFYTFFQPLTLNLVPGQNDCSSLSGSPSLVGGSPFRHSPALFKVGGVNFVMGRRIRFQINFPAAPGAAFQVKGIQIGFGAMPPG